MTTDRWDRPYDYAQCLQQGNTVTAQQALDAIASALDVLRQLHAAPLPVSTDGGNAPPDNLEERLAALAAKKQAITPEQRLENALWCSEVVAMLSPFRQLGRYLPAGLNLSSRAARLARCAMDGLQPQEKPVEPVALKGSAGVQDAPISVSKPQQETVFARDLQIAELLIQLETLRFGLQSLRLAPLSGHSEC